MTSEFLKNVTKILILYNYKNNHQKKLLTIPIITGINRKAKIELAKNPINILFCLVDFFQGICNTTSNTKGEPSNEQTLQIFSHRFGIHGRRKKQKNRGVSRTLKEFPKNSKKIPEEKFQLELLVQSENEKKIQ